MPKGVQNANPEILQRLKAKVALSISFSLNANKNYDLLSAVIFERTGALLSNSTLRRVFQYDSNSHPTQSSLDLISQAIGYSGWDEFVEKENPYPQTDLSQVITMFRLRGLGEHGQTWLILDTYSAHPDFFKLYNAVAQIAIASRDVEFLSRIFDIKGVFDPNRDTLPIMYFIHSLVIGLNQASLMPELVGYYGSSKNAQDHLIESYVDEDNLNGYYYELLQVYHEHKTTAEAQLFYHCLMYQRAIENGRATAPHREFIFRFDGATPVHNLPKGRRFAILMLEAGDSAVALKSLLDETQSLFYTLSVIARITTALHMVKLLFIQRKDELIGNILLLAPEINRAGKNIDDLTNINQIKIYRAYSLFMKGLREEALCKLNEFDPLMVHAFINNHIMDDFRVISGLIKEGP
jgi:hypothetical protein